MYKKYWQELEELYANDEPIRKVLEQYQQVNYQSRWNNLYVDMYQQGNVLYKVMKEVEIRYYS